MNKALSSETGPRSTEALMKCSSSFVRAITTWILAQNLFIRDRSVGCLLYEQLHVCATSKLPPAGVEALRRNRGLQAN